MADDELEDTFSLFKSQHISRKMTSTRNRYFFQQQREQTI